MASTPSLELRRLITEILRNDPGVRAPVHSRRSFPSGTQRNRATALTMSPTGNCEATMLLRTLPSAEECTAPSMQVERRAAVRYLCEHDVVCSALPARERFRACLRNISVHGIGLLLGAPIQVGTDLEIEMRTKVPGLLLTLVARVVHATRQAEAHWLVGCKIVSKSLEEHLLALL